MIFSKKKADGFFRGLGAEFAFKTRDGVFIISGGKVLKVVLGAAPDGTSTHVTLVDGVDSHVIYSGGMEDAARRFVEISNSATDRKSRVHLGRRGTLAFLAAFTAIGLIYVHACLPSRSPTASQSDVQELMQTLPTSKDSMLGVPPGLLGPTGGLPGLTGPQASQLGSGSLIIDKPAFLSLPGEEAAVSKPEARTIETEVEDTAAAIPPYSEDLYTKKPQPAESVAAAPTEQPAAAPEKTTSPVAAAADVPKPEVVATSTAVAEPANEAEAPVEKVVATPVPTTPAVTASPAVTPATPNEEKKAEAKHETLSPEQTKKLAQTAVTNMLSSGMSAEQAQTVMAQLERLNTIPPDELTTEMLAGLPHDLVKLLKDSGISDPKKQEGENGVPFAMIRLPEGVIDQFRGKDGIPSIPTNDSYAALGNKITLQLPGGGDIRTPEDMLGFGFKP